MGERVVISWTFENWLTIILMVVVGFAAYSVVSRTAHKVLAKDNA